MHLSVILSANSPLKDFSMSLTVFLPTYDQKSTAQLTNSPILVANGVIKNKSIEYFFTQSGVSPPENGPWTTLNLPADVEVSVDGSLPISFPKSLFIGDGVTTVYLRQQIGGTTEKPIYDVTSATFGLNISPPVLPYTTEILFGTSQSTTASDLLKGYVGTESLISTLTEADMTGASGAGGSITSSPNLIAYANLPYISDLAKVELRVGDSVVATYNASPEDAWASFNITDVLADASAADKALYIQSLFGNPSTARSTDTEPLKVSITVVDTAGNRSKPSFMAEKLWSTSPSTFANSATYSDGNLPLFLPVQGTLIPGDLSVNATINSTSPNRDQTIIGGVGRDTYIAGKSFDKYTFKSANPFSELVLTDITTPTLVASWEGTDTLQNFEFIKFPYTPPPGTTLPGPVFDIYGTTINPKINLVQSPQGTIIKGTDSNDNIVGGAYNDSINGLNGNDAIDGGFGVDTAIYANDISNYSISTLAVATTTSPARFKITAKNGGSEGVDTVAGVEQFSFAGRIVTITAPISPAEGPGVPTLVATTTLAPTAIGTAVDDVFTYTSGNFTIDGAAGNDTVTFPKGRENYNLFLDSSKSLNIADDFGKVTLKNVERLRFDDINYNYNLGTALPLVARQIEGGASNDILDYSTSVTRVLISGLAGNDSLKGGLGDDTFIGGLGNDLIVGGPGKDIAVINSSVIKIDPKNITLTVNGVPTTTNGYEVLSADGIDQIVGVEYLRINEVSGTKTIDLASMVSPKTIKSFISDGPLKLIPNISNGIVEVKVYFTPTDDLTPLGLDVTVYTNFEDLQGNILDSNPSYANPNLLGFYTDGNVSVIDNSGAKPVQTSKLTILRITPDANLEQDKSYLLGTFKYNLLSGAPSTSISAQIEIITDSNNQGSIIKSNPVLLGFSDADVGNQAYSQPPVNSGFSEMQLSSNIYLGGANNDLQVPIGQGYTLLDGSTTGLPIGTSADRLLMGFKGNDVLFSGDRNDTYLGGAGNDYLIAGAGVDFYSGGTGYDKLSVELQENIIPTQDTIIDLTGAANTSVYKKLIITGQNKSDLNVDSIWYINSIEAFEVIGTNTADSITGSNGDDDIDGMGGIDFITPGLGVNSVSGNSSEEGPSFFGTAKNSRTLDLDTLNYNYINGISLDLNTYTVKPANGGSDFSDKFDTINRIQSGSSTDSVTGRLKTTGTMPDGLTTLIVDSAKAGETFIQLSLGGGSDTVNLDSSAYQYSNASIRVSYDWLLSGNSVSGINLSYNKLGKYIPEGPAVTIAAGVTTIAPISPALILNKQTALAKYSDYGINGMDTLTNVQSFQDSPKNDFFDFSNHIYSDKGFYSSDLEFRSASNRVQLKNGGNDVIKGNGHTSLDFSQLDDGVQINLGQQIKPTSQFDFFYINNNNPNYAIATVGLGNDSYEVKYVGVDNVRGTQGDDTLIGGSDVSWMGESYYDSGAEWFTPEAGNDTIEGANGYTGISYFTSPNGVNFDVWNGTVQGSWAGLDEFTRVAFFEGSEHDDVYNADSKGENLSLNPGLYPNQGWGGSYNFFKPAGGNDTILGNGNTRISYEGAMLPVTVDLSGQDKAIDNYIGVAQLLPNSSYSPIFDNVGKDTLSGVAGAQGSMFNDILIGDDKTNNLRGNSGNDTITGGAGNDTADYANSPTPVVLIESITTSGTWDTARDGWGWNDKLSGIESIIASQFNDYVRVTAKSTHLVQPNRGNDIIERVLNTATAPSTTIPFNERTYVDYGPSGAGVSIFLAGATGNDYLAGVAYDGYLADNSIAVERNGVSTNLQIIASGGKSIITDKLPALTDKVVLSTDNLRNINSAFGSSFDDYFLGGSDSDYFLPRSGFDTIDGGPGSDWLAFDETPVLARFEPEFLHGVYFDMNQKVDTKGFAKINTSYGDQFILVKNIENFIGSKFDDTFIGNSAANILRGDAGDDSIYGGDGNDSFQGGAGNDLIDGGSGLGDLLQYPGKFSDYSYSQELGTDGLSYFVITRKDGEDVPDTGNDRVTGVESFQFMGDEPDIIKSDKDLITNFVLTNASMTYAGGGGTIKVSPTFAALKVDSVETENTLTLSLPSAIISVPAEPSNELSSFDNTKTRYTDGTVVKVYFLGDENPDLNDESNIYVVSNSSPSKFSLDGYLKPQTPEPISTTKMFAFNSSVDTNGTVKVTSSNATDFRKGTYLIETAQLPVTKPVVEIRDVLSALSLVVAMDHQNSSTPYYKYVAADVNQDGEIELADDVMQLLRSALQKSDAFVPKLIALPKEYANMTNSKTLDNPYITYKGGAMYPSPNALEDTKLNLNYYNLSKSESFEQSLVGIWIGDVNANFFNS